MSASVQLGSLLNAQADLNYYTAQLTHWTAKYEANSEKLEKQVKAEDKWNSSFEAAIDNTRDLKASSGGVQIIVEEGNVNESTAKKYADAKVSQYDEELSLELAELDIEYDTMKTLYEALVTQKQTETDSTKQSAATAFQNTHLLQS